MPQFGRTKRQSTFNEKQLEYIFIDDFTPGIYDDYYAGGAKGKFPEGAAQITNTYGCVGAPNGGLVPAPAKVYQVTDTLPVNPTSAVQYLPNDQNAHVVNLHVVSPVTGIGLANSGANYPPTFPDSLWVFSQVWTTAAAGGVYKTTPTCKLYKVWQVPDVSTIGTYSNSFATSVNTVSIANANAPKVVNNPFLYGDGFIDTGRGYTAAPTQPGRATTVFGFGCNMGSAWGGVPLAFPASATPTTDSVDSTAINPSGNILVAHQNRWIMLGAIANANDPGYGTNASIYPLTDYYTYTNVNNISIQASGYTTSSLFYTENPTGLGSCVSMNNSELFLVKISGGAMAIRGDVANPTVVRLPGVEPTGFNGRNTGDILRGGAYAYGSNSGFWEWTGGDRSTCISEGRLGRAFWVVPQMVTHYLKGSSAYVYPFLFTPNNFCYDTRTNGWWRYANPITNGPYAWHRANALGNIIASPVTYNNRQTEIAAYWDLNTGQPYYTWQSHPLPITQTRIMQIEEITVLAQPFSTQVGGTITVTIEGINGAGNQTVQQEVFPFQPGSKPGAITIPTFMQGYDMTVRIESQSADGTSPAPRLYHIGLGIGEATKARN